jgi:hypothetical protein
MLSAELSFSSAYSSLIPAKAVIQRFNLVDLRLAKDTCLRGFLPIMHRGCWRSLGDSKPCFRRERVIIALRRTSANIDIILNFRHFSSLRVRGRPSTSIPYIFRTLENQSIEAANGPYHPQRQAGYEVRTLSPDVTSGALLDCDLRRMRTRVSAAAPTAATGSADSATRRDDSTMRLWGRPTTRATRTACRSSRSLKPRRRAVFSLHARRVR